MKREELKILDLLCDMGIDVNGNRNLQPWKAYDIDEVNLVINELEVENERLKNKVAAYEDERKCLSETITCDADVIYRINKENAELKCLALHSMREYFKAMSALNTWNEEYYGDAKYLHRVIRYDKRTKQYDYAYRKAMLALMGGK